MYCQAKYNSKSLSDLVRHYTRRLDQHPDPVPIVKQMIDETGYVSM
jgi:ATP-dependent DNA helicase Rep